MFFSASSFAQCTTGITQVRPDGKIYGCVEGNWKKLTEDIASNASIGATVGITQNINGIVHGREANNIVSQLPNIGFIPISVLDAPPHAVGKIFYSVTHKHFYEGVANGLWHQIDNEMLPNNLKILDGNHRILSVYDADYQPWKPQTTAANWNRNVGVDGIVEGTLIDYQGIIPSGGLDVFIPVQFFDTLNSRLIPAYSQDVIIPAYKTENNIARVLTIKWDQQYVNTTGIKAKLVPNGNTDLLVKKLDFNSGYGRDFSGVELAKFIFNGLNYIGSFTVNVIPGVPDRKAGIMTNGKYEHDFVYVVNKSVDNIYYLNQVLGAEVTKIKEITSFNPFNENYRNDLKTDGSLFQWGRDSDGHELVTRSDTGIRQPRATTTVRSSTYFPNHNMVIDDTNASSFGRDIWMQDHLFLMKNMGLWDESSNRNPCPMGFGLADKSFLTPASFGNGSYTYIQGIDIIKYKQSWLNMTLWDMWGRTAWEMDDRAAGIFISLGPFGGGTMSGTAQTVTHHVVCVKP
ncbi:hypothetical protein JSO61_006505 [Riemerella anatipestifer]|uniref:hypothetical protein n=1 Tax=Riemerella anatipestifer TaxID=34085 RepID=UPI0030C604A4